MPGGQSFAPAALGSDIHAYPLLVGRLGFASSMTGCVSALQWRWRPGLSSSELPRISLCGLASYSMVPVGGAPAIRPRKASADRVTREFQDRSVDLTQPPCGAFLLSSQRSPLRLHLLQPPPHPDKKVPNQGLTAGRPLCYNRCRRGGTHMRTELGLERSGPFLLPR